MLKSTVLLIQALLALVHCVQDLPTQLRLSLTGDPTQMTVMYCTNDDTPTSTVMYRIKGSTQWKTISSTDATSHYYWPLPPASSPVFHTLTMDGLIPATQYEYQVGDSQSGFSNTTYFWTERVLRREQDRVQNTKTNTTFVASIGDMGTSPHSIKVFDLLQKWNAENRFSLLVHAGDISYANGVDKYWDIWGNLVQPISQSVPWMTAVGNHEIFDAFVPFLWRFAMPSHQSNAPFGNMFFSFDYENIHFMCLSSEELEYWHIGDQYKWIESDLQKVNRTKTPWIIASWHSPWYCSNEKHQGSGTDMRDSYEDLLYKYKVDIVLNGHVHAYERTHPIYKDKIDPLGPVFITNGLGGTAEGIYDHWIQPSPVWSAKTYGKNWGLGALEILSDSTAQWTWREVDSGDVIDSATIVRQR